MAREAVSEWCERRGGSVEREEGRVACAALRALYARAACVMVGAFLHVSGGGADEPAPAAGALGRETVAGEIV